MANAFLQKRGKVWYARYRDWNGKERWKSLQTNSKEIAHTKLARIIKAVEKQNVWGLKAKSINEYLQEYLAICEAEHSKRTVRVEKQTLRDFLAFVGAQTLAQITADRIEAYKVLRAKDVSKSTVNRTLAMIKAFLNRAVSLGYLDRNPAQFVKRLKEEQTQIEYLSDDTAVPTFDLEFSATC